MDQNQIPPAVKSLLDQLVREKTAELESEIRELKERDTQMTDLIRVQQKQIAELKTISKMYEKACIGRKTKYMEQKGVQVNIAGTGLTNGTIRHTKFDLPVVSGNYGVPVTRAPALPAAAHSWNGTASSSSAASYSASSSSLSSASKPLLAIGYGGAGDCGSADAMDTGQPEEVETFEPVINGQTNGNISDEDDGVICDLPDGISADTISNIMQQMAKVKPEKK